MAESVESGWGGFPMLILIALATALAWAFGNPFFGFVVVLGTGLAILAVVEFVRGHRRPHS